MNGGETRRAYSRPRSGSVVPAVKFANAQEQLAPIVFNGTGAYLVTGPESRQVYCFIANDPEQVIDAKDAEALLRMGPFSMSGQTI